MDWLYIGFMFDVLHGYSGLKHLPAIEKETDGHVQVGLLILVYLIQL